MKELETNRQPGLKLLATVTLITILGASISAVVALIVSQRLGGNTQTVVVSSKNGNGTSTTSINSIINNQGAAVVKIGTSPVNLLENNQSIPGLANGALVSSDGLVITSLHAVTGATQLKVTTNDGHQYDANVAVADVQHGLALLQLANASGLPFLNIANGYPVPGDAAITLASQPFSGIGLMSGVVINVGRTLNVGTPMAVIKDLLMIDDVNDPHNDGAPILNASGALIGVDLGAEHSGVAQLVALSGRAVANLMAQVSNGNHKNNVTFGIDNVVMDPATAGLEGLSSGALVLTVDSKGPAAAIGLHVGEVITAVNGIKIDQSHPLDAQALGFSAGQIVNLSVTSPSGRRELQITIAVG